MNTQEKILQIIEKNGRVRPIALYEALKISRQALHRHLRNMVQAGILEIQGTMPTTRYALAGVPGLEGVAGWINARTVAQNPKEMVCETRDVLAARLGRLQSLTKNGLSKDLLPLVLSTAGEIGNNSFDHNSGQWRDMPGCWFEAQSTGKHLWICIADRGQGVLRSLAKVHPEIKDDQKALKAAFETIISGRAPEQRGNGLKFARENVSMSGAGLACMSGVGRVCYGDQGEKALSFLKQRFSRVGGTITLLTWRLK